MFPTVTGITAVYTLVPDGPRPATVLINAEL